MIRTLLIALAFTLISGVAMAKEAMTTLKVSGWHCGGCTAATEATVKKVAGVKSAKANLEAGTLTVQYDDSVASAADVEKAVQKAGYQIIRQ